jgi:hypothetical protein
LLLFIFKYNEIPITHGSAAYDNQVGDSCKRVSAAPKFQKGFRYLKTDNGFVLSNDFYANISSLRQFGGGQLFDLLPCTIHQGEHFNPEVKGQGWDSYSVSWVMISS